MKEIIGLVLTAFTTGGGISYLVNKRKRKIELEKLKAEKTSIDLENIESVIELWKRMVTELTADVKNLTSEVESLRKENKQLKEEIQKLEKTLQDYQQNK